MCAPAALSVGDTLYLFQSTFDRRPIYSTETPQTVELGLFNPLLPCMPGAPGPWDPDIFHDADSDRWFMYFGSSNLYPLFGVELDYRNQLTYIGTANELIALHPELNGWERFGRDHREATKPFIEGAWMTLHNGKYYLQYAAPGTEYNVYANGTYVGDGSSWRMVDRRLGEAVRCPGRPGQLHGLPIQPVSQRDQRLYAVPAAPFPGRPELARAYGPSPGEA